MSDLPKWAQDGDDANASGDLGDKLVDESAASAPPSPTPAAAATDVAPRPEREEGVVSKSLCFFRFLAIITVVLALVVIGTNCYIVYQRSAELKARGILLRVYGVLFCVFVIFAELEWTKFTKFFGFLKYWPARGLFYIFVGLITWDQTDGTSTSYGAYEDVVSFLMMGVGGVYFALGLACMRTVKEAENARMAEESANANA